MECRQGWRFWRGPRGEFARHRADEFAAFVETTVSKNAKRGTPSVRSIAAQTQGPSAAFGFASLARDDKEIEDSD